MNRWHSVMRRPVRFVMNLQWFKERGLVFLQDMNKCFLPNLMGSVTDRRAVYLAGTCRSVGRG